MTATAKKIAEKVMDRLIEMGFEHSVAMEIAIKATEGRIADSRLQPDYLRDVKEELKKL